MNRVKQQKSQVVPIVGIENTEISVPTILFCSLKGGNLERSETDAQRAGASGTQSSQPTAPRSRSSRRIERAVHRDPLGAKEVPTTPVETSKCSFLGPIGVTIQQFEESGVWHVECQNCGARRDMKKVKDRQKFPSHPPRKTPPPKGEERWVLLGVGWKLIKD